MHINKNIVVAGQSDLLDLFVRHVSSREHFEKDFPYRITYLYEKETDKKPKRYNQKLPIETDITQIVASENVDIIIDFQEGVRASYDLIWNALNAGKHVITTNTAVMAIHGEKLTELAKAHRVHLCFGASVLGGVSAINTIKEGSFSWYTSRIQGVLNSACNYILKRMHERHCSLEEAKKAAIELGYAHKNPEFDLSGKDSLYKAALLHACAYGTWFNLKKADVTPLSAMTEEDLLLATQLGYLIRYVALAESEHISVTPTLLEENTLLSRMDGTLTGVVIDGEQIGSIFLSGYGADKHAIVASIMNDLFSIHTHKVETNALPKASKREHFKKHAPHYFLRVSEEQLELISEHPSLSLIEKTALEPHKNHRTLRPIGVIVETPLTRSDLKNIFSTEDDPALIMNLLKG